MKKILSIFSALVLISCANVVKTSGPSDTEMPFADTVVVNKAINLSDTRAKLLDLGYTIDKFEKDYIETDFRSHYDNAMTYDDKVIVYIAKNKTFFKGKIKQDDLKLVTESRNWKPDSMYSRSWNRIKKLVPGGLKVEYEIKNEFVYAF
ncbi:hypothetical protein [Kangiella sp.]|uniref:hypothetical protein n=1 Tax=Kangiella sp. TaxID=1920245 RepID=UPI003A914B7E